MSTASKALANAGEALSTCEEETAVARLTRSRNTAGLSRNTTKTPANTINCSKMTMITAIKPIKRCIMPRSEEHTSELQSLMSTSSTIFCLKKQKKKHPKNNTYT